MASEIAGRMSNGQFEPVTLPSYLGDRRPVRAAKIVTFTYLNPEKYRLVLEGACHVDVTHQWVRSNQPAAGGYYVIEPDGHSFFVSAEKFAEFTLSEKQPASPARSEPDKTAAGLPSAADLDAAAAEKPAIEPTGAQPVYQPAEGGTTGEVARNLGTGVGPGIVQGDAPATGEPGGAVSTEATEAPESGSGMVEGGVQEPAQE